MRRSYIIKQQATAFMRRSYIIQQQATAFKRRSYIIQQQQAEPTDIVCRPVFKRRELLKQVITTGNS